MTISSLLFYKIGSMHYLINHLSLIRNMLSKGNLALTESSIQLLI